MFSSYICIISSIRSEIMQNQQNVMGYFQEYQVAVIRREYNEKGKILD